MPSSCLLPSEPAILRSSFDADDFFFSPSRPLTLTQRLTSNLVSSAHAYHHEQRKNLRRKSHILTLLQACTNEPHLVIEPLHPIFAAENTLRIFIINNLRSAYFTYENALGVVHESIDVKGIILLFTLGTNVTLVVKFLI